MRTVHAPHLDLAVVRAGHDEGQRGMEGGPVDAPVVPLQHILHHRIATAEQIRVHLHPPVVSLIDCLCYDSLAVSPAQNLLAQTLQWDLLARFVKMLAT